MERFLVMSSQKKIMAKYSKKAQEKVAETMHEMKEGKLKSGRSGKKVKDPQTGNCHWIV
jgi:hypothetical protein